MSYSRGPPEIKGMTSLKVDNLTYRTTPDDLRRAFKEYGEIGDVYIPRDRYSRESRGFAFVRFFDRRDAEDAMDGMDGKRLDGRELRVQMARYGRPETPPYRRRRRRSRSRSRSRGDRRRRHSSRSRSRSRDRRRRSRSRSKSRSRSNSRSRSGSKSRSRSQSVARRESDPVPEKDRENGYNSADAEGEPINSGGMDEFRNRFKSYSRSRSRSLENE